MSSGRGFYHLMLTVRTTSKVDREGGWRVYAFFNMFRYTRTCGLVFAVVYGRAVLDCEWVIRMGARDSRMIL